VKKTTERWAWIGGIAAAAAAAVGVTLVVKNKSAAAAPTPAPGPVLGTGPVTTPTPGTALKFSGPYNKLAANVLQPYASYLIEMPAPPPGSGQTYLTAGAYLASIAPAPGITVIQSFDAGQMPKDWPSAATGVWRYVVMFGGNAPPKSVNPLIHGPPPWTLPPGYTANVVSVWTVNGAAA
jgi:hypothetical protein